MGWLGRLRGAWGGDAGSLSGLAAVRGVWCSLSPRFPRISEPLSAFEEPELSRWVAYAASPHRPRRREALEAEYTDALRRVAAVPPIVVPEAESEHAYVRWADGVI